MYIWKNVQVCEPVINKAVKYRSTRLGPLCGVSIQASLRLLSQPNKKLSILTKITLIKLIPLSWVSVHKTCKIRQLT